MIQYILIGSIIIVTVCVFQVIRFIVHQNKSPLYPHWHRHYKMKYGQCFDSVICISTESVKINTWMNHHNAIHTDTWIKIVQIKYNLLHSLLNNPVICTLHYHSVEPSQNFPFPVSSLVEISSLLFSEHNQ